MTTPVLTSARLREILIYDPETGVFKNRVFRGPLAIQGAEAGYVNPNGYIVIVIERRLYQAGPLAVLYMTGQWPNNHVDHLDTDPANNRFDNLRDVTAAVNNQNRRKATRRSRSGFLGVCKSRERWKAAIMLDNKSIYLGTYDTPEVAHDAYVQAKRRLHAGCTI